MVAGGLEGARDGEGRVGSEGEVVEGLATASWARFVGGGVVEVGAMAGRSAMAGGLRVNESCGEGSRSAVAAHKSARIVPSTESGDCTLADCCTVSVVPSWEVPMAVIE